MANLANKYRPRNFEDIVEQDLVVQIVKNLCDSDQLTNRNFLFIGPAGTGKAQPLYSKVLTTAGFKLMEDIQIGDEVFTGKGNIAKVSGIYPQGVRPIYEITLQDRTCIRVSDEHLNIVYRYNEDKKQREDFCLTTTELINLYNQSRFRLRIDIPKVDWRSEELPVDPYLLGALIGDGNLSNNFQFSNSEKDVIDKVDAILRRDWNKCLRKCPGDNVDYDIVDINHSSCKYVFSYKGNQYFSGRAIQEILYSEGYPKFDVATILRIADGTASNSLKHHPELNNAITYKIDDNYTSWQSTDTLKHALTELGVCCKSVDKRIPRSYLLASEQDRLQLLRGLFDTDGYTDKSGITTFTTCSGALSEDFAFLTRSLGIRDTVTSSPAKYVDAGDVIYTGSVSYDHHIKVSNSVQYCSSAKHTARRAIRQNEPMRNITDIRYVGEEPCQCIMLDHPDHTYISDGFIPTHNTTISRIIASELNEGVGEVIEIDAASHGSIDNVRNIVEQAKKYPVGSKYKVFILDECHSFSNTSWQVFLKVLEESPAMTVMIFCTTNPEKIPATILSRVQTFKLSKISLEGVSSRLKYVLDSEIAEGQEITYDEEAVNFVARLSNGGMRDALTTLDKALAYSTEINMHNLEVALNLPNYDNYFKLLQSYAKRDNSTTVATIDDVYNSGINFIQWFEGFHSFVINVVKYILLGDINRTLVPSHYEDRISKYSSAHLKICLDLSDTVLKLIHDLKSTQYLQEVAITYLCRTKKGDK